VFCRNGKIDAATIGRTLRNLCDRITGGFVLRKTGEDRAGVVLWSVVASCRCWGRRELLGQLA
jgi:hypothetical protein